MTFRIVGVLVLLAGAGLVVLGIYGTVDVNSQTAFWASRAVARDVVFDAARWSHHWVVYGELTAAIGLPLVLAGTAMVAKRHWALCAAASAFAIAALVPVFYEWLGFAEYNYELAGVGWPVTFLALAAMFLAWDLIMRRPSRIGLLQEHPRTAAG